MVITDRFVLLNFPKTGSTFARTVLGRLHPEGSIKRALVAMRLANPAIRDLHMERYRMDPSEPVKRTQHLVYAQVPDEHRHKTIVSIMRDPFARLISAYEFKDWIRALAAIPEIGEEYPHFPKLTFEEYVTAQFKHAKQHWLPADGAGLDLGPHTIQFIRFYARDPKAYLMGMRPGRSIREDLANAFAPVRFLHTENLNLELYDLLKDHGYAEDRIAFVREMNKVKTTIRSRQEYFTPPLRALVLHRERMLFDLFPEYKPTES